MMDFSNYNIGLGITGSFCTFAKARKEIQRLCDMGANVVPVFSFNAQTCDTRFGSAKDYVDGICEITGNEGIRTICAAEPIGPNNFLDIMVIAPCTGNTAAKLCNGITDTPVLMATKAHMRNGKPLVIAISTNDALGASFKNIGMLMNMKNIYFVPFGQDNCKSKPNSSRRRSPASRSSRFCRPRRNADQTEPGGGRDGKCRGRFIMQKIRASYVPAASGRGGFFGEKSEHFFRTAFDIRFCVFATL